VTELKKFTIFVDKVYPIMVVHGLEKIPWLTIVQPPPDLSRQRHGVDGKIFEEMLLVLLVTIQTLNLYKHMLSSLADTTKNQKC
jgi:hypothetical protein